MLKIISACALLLCGCSTVGQPSPQQSCSPLPGWAEVAKASEGKFLIFGEMHGTREGPQAVQEFVCQVTGDPVLVAIEFDSPMNAQWQKAWATPGDLSTSMHIELPTVFGYRPDGVASQAMLDMLSRLHALKNAGAQIDLVAFNGPRDAEQRKRFADLPSQEPHEAAQAENIREAASARSYRHVVVLVGSVHAQKAPVALGDTKFAPMATKLAPPEQVISLRMDRSGGSAWNCIMKPEAAISGRPPTMQDLDCSAHEGAGLGPSRDRPSMGLSPQPGFDGYYFVGATNASPPPRP